MKMLKDIFKSLVERFHINIGVGVWREWRRGVVKRRGFKRRRAGEV